MVWVNSKKGKDKGMQHDDISLLDARAVQAARLLMTINVREASNRQCAAASTSALFNLLMNNGQRGSESNQTQEHMKMGDEIPPSTAQLLQPIETRMLTCQDCELDETKHVVGREEKFIIKVKR